MTISNTLKLLHTWPLEDMTLKAFSGEKIQFWACLKDDSLTEIDTVVSDVFLDSLPEKHRLTTLVSLAPRIARYQDGGLRLTLSLQMRGGGHPGQFIGKSWVKDATLEALFNDFLTENKVNYTLTVKTIPDFAGFTHTAPDQPPIKTRCISFSVSGFDSIKVFLKGVFSAFWLSPENAKIFNATLNDNKLISIIMGTNSHDDKSISDEVKELQLAAERGETLELYVSYDYKNIELKSQKSGGQKVHNSCCIL